MIRAIVTDIEGTTSSLSFVKDVLFPYARQHLPAFVRARHNDPAVRTQLQAACESAGIAPDPEAAIELLIRWIDQDRKATPLKALQGMIWETGYRNGELRGHIYADAHDVLQRWHAQGLKLYVYSSGSAQAQQLLFGYTEYGDLTPLFSGYFDTRIGAKQDLPAYRHILEAIGLPGDEVLFLSDITSELDAAKAAGMHTGWLVRDAALAARSTHPAFGDFHAIDVQQYHA